MRWKRPLAAIALALLASAPGAAPLAARPAATRHAVHPISGLPVIVLTIRHGARTYRFRVELARTDAEQARGLMFRQAMGADEGMIFPMRPPRDASFWMRNTLLPLDIVFIGADGRIMSVAEGAPLSDAQILSGGPVKGVLELNAGRAAQLGVGAGDTVRW